MTEPAVGSETGAVTVAGLLRARAAERLAFTFLADGEAEGGRLTYGELDRRAAAIAAALAGSVRPGDRALLLYPPGLDFIAAFFGCLYAGVVAVPAYPPRPNDRSQSRLRAIARDAAPRAALTTEAILAGAVEPRGLLAVAPELAGLRWIPTEALSSSAGTAAALLPDPDPESVAFLQYTSGSTATPKGVMVTHANLLHNERMIGAAFQMDEDSVVVGWLPLYHDMGLIGNVLQPLHAGATCVLMSPVAFLQRPMRWLEAIGRYRGTTSGGPNFAYELCVRKASPEAIAGLDLASWRVAFNGAEPVRASTLERFAATFAPCGFRPEAFYPCYGLAEATLFVSGGAPVQAPRVDSEGRRVSCGHAWMGQRIAVADPETGVEAASGAEGEVWIAGPSVARGYWENPAATARDFNAFLATGEGPFLRTGDLGFLSGGELYVTGRLKDLIILRGRNLYPQDVELTAEGAHPDLRPGGGAAFAVEGVGSDGEERLVIVHEVGRRRDEKTEEIAEALRRAVAAEHEVQVHEVVLIRQGGLPKTSSGKVQRRLCRELYLQGELPVVGRSALAAADPAPEIAIALEPGALAALEPAERRGMLAAWLRERAAAVLGVAASSISTQPLTALGLDSLTAVELKGSVEAALGLTVPLADLLQGIGVEGLAGRMLAGLEAPPETSALPPRALSLAGDQPLSAGQRALWFLERLAPEAGTYNVAVAARALGGVDVEALRRALARLTERHAALRTVIRAVDGEPFQRAVPGLAPDVAVEDGQEWSAEELRGRLAREAWRPFDLETGPPLRARIYELAGGERALLLAVHHLVCDFWSLAVMARELGAVYREETGGPPAGLVSPALQYADFVHWQEASLARGDGMDFWRRELAGVRDLDLPTDRPRPPAQGWRGLARAAELPADLAGALRSLAAGQGATLFAALLAAFQAQLGRYAGHAGGQDSFAVGTPTAGRGAPEWAGVVGYFVNPVALRADLAGDPPFRDLLDRARRTSLAALEHAEVPFVLLAERLRPARDPARPPLFQVMLALQQRRPGDDPGLPAFALGEDGARISLATLELESIGLAERRAQFEISLNAAELASGSLGLSIEVNSDLFDAATAERMLGHFHTLLAAAVEEPGRALSDLPLLTAAEREELLLDWRATAEPSGPTPALPLHELVMEVARRAPEALAVVVGEERLTYGELMERSGALARRLRQLGVKPEVPVALCVERSADLVVGALGILQAGGVYLPLDPDSSAARLGFVLQDAGAAALVTQRRVISRLPETSTPVLRLDDLASDGGAGPEAATVLPDHLAYLIYTSGSTGRPKGVAVTHAAAVEHCLTWARAYGMGGRDRVLQFPSAGFDASVEQIFSALLTGATLALRGPEMWGPRELSGRIEELGLTIVDLPTAFFSRWVQDAGDLGVPPTLRLIGTYGEELRAETVRRWSQTPLAGVPLLNCYGPTETVVSATLHRVRPEEGETGLVPIGRALPGRVARVLDPLGHPRPDGLPGELALSGPLARGYLGRPDLTAERFAPDPFGAPGSRLYRSGDLARRRPDGAIEFLGRLDDQVKVRGFRVEPGEIEAVLAEHPDVREAAVLALAGPDGDRRLVAFVAPAIPDGPGGLLAFLRRRLPDYMLPAAWSPLPALPLNASGKVDRAALAARAAEAEAPEAAGEEEARTPEEELLAGIWADLLVRGRVGVHDDFFALGGHSLLATRVVARVSRVFGIDLPVSALFQTPTVAGLAARIAGATAAPGTEAAPPVRPVPRPPGAALPLSFAQRRLWFLDQLEPGSAVYNVPGEVRLEGALDAPALAAAFGEVLRRHEALRAVFLAERGEPVQRIGPPTALMPLVDLSALPEAAQEREAERRARAEARRPFDLAHGPVCRALLLRLEPEDHRLCVTFHHIAADDWSLDLFLDELSSLYGAVSTGNVPALPELPVQYPDFAVWQRDWLSGGELERQLAYWRGRLAGLPVLELPADRPRPAVRDPRGAVRSLILPASTAEAVAALARREGVTLFMALLGVFQILLARVTGETAIPVGSPVANRRRPEVERLIGLFVNTLVLDVRVGDDPALRDLLARVREAALGAYAHQDLPFERLVEELAPSRDLSQNPLFQVVLVLEEPLPARSVAGLSLEPVRRDSGTAKFDLVLAVSPRPDGGWDVFAEHSAALYDRATVERLLGQWRTLLEGAAAADPSTPLSRLPLLTAPERQQVHAEWNDTRADFPAGLRLHDLIAAQAARTPDAVAVVGGGDGEGDGEGERVTYRGLMERAGRLARFLRAEGVGPESRVGLCLERSPELLAGVLGILQAGGAYLPLDPAYPQERLELMLADAGAELLVTQSSLAGRFGFFAGRTVLLDADRARIDAAPEVESPEADESNLAYVIYTSGSTGRPKGVAIEHRSAVTLVHWGLATFPPEILAGSLAATSVCFDISIFELFVPLAMGGKVILAPNVVGLPQLAAIGEVTIVNAVPSPMAELVGSRLPAGLRIVNLGGEALKADLVERIYAHPQVERVCNLYGPSEDTTYSTCAWVPKGASLVTIGRPIANTGVRVLGRYGEPVPQGAHGELFLSGAGLSRGYLGRPELTADRFVPDPFGPPGARMYRTGDRVRFLPGGELDFLGRFDHQVKLHGIRMELGEIEAVLEQHPAVRQGVAALRSDGPEGARLVGYLVPEVVSEEGMDALAADVSAFLRARLPGTMVPTAWVVLPALPLSPNGKVDRRLLPAPARAAGAGAVAPRTPAEETLAALWSEVLGLERVGVHDDFFELGGHSLLAVRAAFRTAEAFGVEVPVAALFQAPTIAELAEWLAKAGSRAASPAPAVPGEVDGEHPLSFAQHRLWFLDRLRPGGSLYNLQVVVRLEGRLNVAVLGRALAEIVRRHEPLRTVYPDRDGDPYQEILPPPAEPPLTRLSLAGLPGDPRARALDAVLHAAVERPFDLRRGPVEQFLLIETGPEESLLAAAFHHIATDGWSMGLFAGELAALYAAFADGRPSPLPELPLRYVDLAAAERRELAGPALEPRLAYWRRQLAGLPPLDLPGDRPRRLTPSPRAIAERIDLPDALAAALRGLARGSGVVGVTPFMVLLGGFTALLARLTGQEDFGVGVPTAGRQRPEAQGMIGLFVNTLVVRTPLGGDPPFLDLLQRVRDVTVAAQVHQEVPFDKLVDELQPDRGSALTPLFQVLFTYLSDPESPLRMPGVSATLLDLGPMVTQFDLTLALHEWEGRLHGWLSFRADLFEAATAARMAGHLRTLLAAAAAEPGRRLWDLPLLSAAERDQLVDWSGEPESGLATTVHRLFEERARLAPADPALISGEETVSYAGLDARANRLARHLLALGTGPEARIAVWLERSVELDVAMLAALKAGGVYLPIDAGNPPERVRWLLEDSGAAVLVSREELAARLPLATARVLVDRDAAAIAGRSAESPGIEVDPRALAYVIYTSGSTGWPKGVGVPHGAAAAHLEAVRRYYGLAPGDRTLQFTSPGFDAAVEQFLAPLIAGAALVVRGAELWTARELTRRIGELGLTYVNLPTAYWNRWVNDPGEPGEPDEVGPVSPPLRLVMTGGQEMLGANARLWFRSPMAAARLLNGYGPTETVITPTLHEVLPEDGEAAVVPVGRPVPGRSGWIVDHAGNLLPPGVPGELLLGGPLARGYLGRPDLTAEGFVPDPFSGRPGERLYRTGDRARHRPDGVLEFLGRIDAQVKVRGFRVEPGEIEALLTRHPGVREAVVVAREEAGGDRSLAAYVVPAADADDELAAALQAHLRASLPEYMVPAAWVTLPALPLNANGKVDRRALPDPVPTTAVEGEGSAPATPEEELLAGLFAGLLGRERVGADDDFFALGGHSLLATQLASRVRALFGVELPLAEIFERPTPAGLADRLAAARRAAGSGGGVGDEPPPLVREESATAPLSFAQQRLWFLHQLDPAAEAYQAPGALRLRGPLDEAALERALGEIVRRHEALRTVFRIEGSAPVQVVLPPPAARLPVADLAALPEEAREPEAARLLAREARRPFALERGPLARFLLLRLGREERLLAMVMHHVVSDAWSLGVLVRELTALYAAFAAGGPSPLPELPVQYPDFARWQRRWLAGETLEREVAHWRRTLAGAPESLELPYDRPPGPATGTRGGRRRFELPAGLYGGLLELARRDGWTPFMALLAGFQALLARLAHDDGQEDVVVGSPVANRNRLELEGLIGFFTNTLALRLDLSGDPSFWELGRRVRAVALDAYSHQDVPFEKLVEELAPERQPGRNPLFQAMLVLQKLPAPPALPGVAAELLDVDAGTAKFDLALLLVEAEGAAAGILEYARDLFDEATVDRLLGHLRTLIEGAVEDPGRRLSALPLLTPPEREELRAWSRALTPEPATLLIHEGVAAQAARTPDAVAVIFGEGGDETLTYAELTARSRRLARRLRAVGVGPDVPVGLFLERSPDLMVAVLGVLEAGGAYLPLDPGYPAERLRLMLEDARAPVLLTHAPLAGSVPAGAGRVVRVDEPEGLDEGEGPPISSDVLPDHLVYVIYTSGSTGRPKGVAMTHGALSAMLRWQLRTSAAGAGRTLQFTSMSFDVSFQEIFSTWWSGGALVLVSEETRRDPAALARLLAERRVERLFLPFVALQQVATAAIAADEDPADEDPSAFPSSLREVMSAGEQLFVTPQVAELFARLPGAALYNHYGPSEAHAITWLALAGDPALWPERPAIGAPVDHARIFLLDAGLQPVPVGVTGEIWVGGPGLGRGYLGRPDLTAERFLPDPFAGDAGVEGIGAPPGERLYRTGDLARRRPDGVLEYLGRRDFQVKIRGQRVELFEVEAALARHPAVRQAAVAVRGDGAEARRLVAYVNFQEGTEPPAFAGLREFLAASLPDPMVPSAWARVDALPLTATGKLDRRALARIEPEEGAGGGSFVAPRTPAEELLAEIWRQVLGIGPLGHVGAHDDFFQLGGHSLLATQVASRIRQSFGVSLPLRRIFESSTLAAMAAAILDVEGGGTPAPPIRRAPREGDLPLSFAQERLWFLHRLQPESPAYNIPLVLRAEGPLDPARLAAALSAVARRHEVLRTVFAERDGEPVQVVLPATEVPLPVVDLGALPADRRESEAGRIAAAEAARPFDLARGPLLRAVLLELAARRRELLLDLHHIVTDGWSMGVLVREVKALYAGAPLPEPPVQYADFAVWQRGWLTGEVLERQIAWWRERLRGASTVLELPADHPRPPVLTQRGAEHPFALDRELSRGISALARQEGVTPFMVLAAALFALLARLTGQRDLTIGSPIANRNHLETEELIGFFVNTLVLRADLSRAASFRDLLRQVRESSLGAYAHQDLPFEKLVDEIQPGRDLSRSPLFQVAVALQNAPLPVADLGGVRLAAEEISTGIAKFDLSFVFAEAADGGLAGILQYATDLFAPATAARYARHFAVLLAGLVVRPRARLSAAPLLSPEECHQILREWNDTRREWPGDPALHELFERQADLQPGAPAVLCGDAALTYGELEERANRLAHHLRSLGVGRSEPVGLWMRRSLDLPAAVLGILKAGAIYMPLDAAWPAERVEAILCATGASALIAGSALLRSVREIEGRLPALRHVVCPEEPAPRPGSETGPEAVAATTGRWTTGWHVARRPGTRPSAACGADDVAYLIHTSGSTGEPKGIVIRHRGAANTLRWNNETLGIGPGDRHLFVNSVGFDLSIYDLLGMLGAGAAVRVATEEELQDPARLAALLSGGGITVWNSAPAALQRLAPFFPAAGEGRDLRRVLLAGDWIPLSLPDAVRTAFPRALVGNFGGATETSVWSNWHRIGAVDPAWAGIPYGRPIVNVRYYVLDAELSPCPAGVPGDNHIGGEGLALGYAGLPALTAERFLPDPFSPEPGARMYASGDRVRFWADGTMEFLGRIDSQVKVRGYRIELGEIESALLRHAGIREAVVLAREDVPGEKRLVGYVVPAGTETPAPATAELRAFLRETLPEYMVPWSFVELEALPVTANGKLDREALPAPRELAAGSVAQMAPRNDLERAIGAVWCEVLGLDRVGVQESFFEAGGSSLLLGRVQSRLLQAIGREVPFVDLFRHPTIESLARSLEGSGPPPEEQAEAARARTETRRESMRQLQQARGQRRGRKWDR